MKITGGAYQTETSPAADACCYRYVSLIETAWLDQQYFGDWSSENLIG